MASKRHIRKKACERKVKHNLESANIAVRNLMKNGKANFNIYGCQFCGSYHVGHRPHNIEGV